MNFDHFKLLPLETQIDIIVKYIDPNTLKNLCATDLYFSGLCQNEIIWRQVFKEFSNSLNPSPYNTASIQASNYGGTMLEKTRLLWTLSHPEPAIIFVLTKTSNVPFPGAKLNKIVYYEDDDDEPEHTLEQYKSTEIIIAYLTQSRDEAIRCLCNDMNNKVEPVYTQIRNLIERKVDHMETKYDYPGMKPEISGHIQALKDILSGKRQLTPKFFEYSFFGYGNLHYTDEYIYSTDLFLYKFGDSRHMIAYLGSHGDIKFAVTRNPEEDEQTEKDFAAIIQKQKIFFQETASRFVSSPTAKKPFGTMTANELMWLGSYNNALYRLSEIEYKTYTILPGLIGQCSLFSSLVPKRIPFPQPVRYTKSVSRLNPPQPNERLPPPESIPPPVLKDKRSFPPPPEWIKRFE